MADVLVALTVYSDRSLVGVASFELGVTERRIQIFKLLFPTARDGIRYALSLLEHPIVASFLRLHVFEQNFIGRIYLVKMRISLHGQFSIDGTASTYNSSQ